MLIYVNRIFLIITEALSETAIYSVSTKLHNLQCILACHGRYEMQQRWKLLHQWRMLWRFNIFSTECYLHSIAKRRPKLGKTMQILPCLALNLILTATHPPTGKVYLTLLFGPSMTVHCIIS